MYFRTLYSTLYRGEDRNTEGDTYIHYTRKRQIYKLRDIYIEGKIEKGSERNWRMGKWEMKGTEGMNVKGGIEKGIRETEKKKQELKRMGGIRHEKNRKNYI